MIRTEQNYTRGRTSFTNVTRTQMYPGMAQLFSWTKEEKDNRLRVLNRQQGLNVACMLPS